MKTVKGLTLDFEQKPPSQKTKVIIGPLLEKCPNTELFWSVFSFIRTEYGDLQCKSSYSVRIQENTDHTDQKKLRIGTLFRQYQKSQKVMGIINKLIGKGVIEYTEYEKGEFISLIFFRSKSDKTSRIILSLKTLNEFLEYNHFKMEKVHSVVDFFQPHCYMTCIDFKDIYYSVKICEEN